MIGPILRRAEAGRQPGHREVALLIKAAGSDVQALLEAASRIAHRRKGAEPGFKAVIPLDSDASPEAPVLAAQQAVTLGCSSVILLTDGPVDVQWIADLIRRVKEAAPVHLSLCLGERSYDEYAQWRQAGADQYVLPHETCNEQIYALLHPGRCPSERLTRYLWLRGLGYEVGGGMLSGCMNKSTTCTVDDLEILMNIGMESVLIDPAVPIEDTLKLVAIVRLCLPDADIWVRSPDFAAQAQALACGANVIVGSLAEIAEQRASLR